MTKHFLPALLLLLAYVPAQAQAPADPLPWRIDRHIYYARYAEAKTEAETAVQSRATEPQSLGYAVALSELSRVRLAFAKYQAADTLLSAAIAIFEQQSATADSAYLKTCRWAAENCRSLAQYPRAEEWLKRGLGAANNKGAEAFRADLLLEYANWYADMSCNQQAQMHYGQAVEVLEKAFGKKSVWVARALTNWAIFQKSQSHGKEADALLVRALKILEPLAEQFPVEYLRCLKAQADLFNWELPRYREAEFLYKKAIDFATKHLGERHPELAEALRSAASHFKDKTVHFHRADTLFRQALAIYEYHFGTDYPSCVGVLQDISGWQNTLGYATLAVNTRQEAYERCRGIYGDIHPMTAGLLLALASEQDNKGETEAAETNLEKADSIYGLFYQGVHQSKKEYLMTRASMARSAGNYGKADSLYHLALDMSKALYGEGTYDWWNVIDRISSNLEGMQQFEKSDSLLSAKSVFIKKQYGEKSLEYAFLLSSSYYLLNSKPIHNYPKEEETLRDRLSTVEACIGKENFWYILALQPFCTFLTKQQRYPEAEAAIQELERVVLNVYGEKSKYMTDVLTKKIDLLETTHPPLESVPLYKQKLVIQREMGGSIDQYVLNMTSLASHLSTSGYYEEAQKLLEDAAQEGRKLGKANKYYFLTMLVTATQYSYRGNYPKVKQYLDECKSSIESMGNPPDLQGYYISSWEDYLEATEQYQAAEQILLQKIKDDESDADNYSQYGQLLNKMNRFSEAEKWFRKTIELSEKVGNKKNKWLDYGGLANNLWRQDRYSEAIKISEKAVSLAKAEFGAAHPSYASALQNHATLLSGIGQKAAAHQMYEEALGIIGRTQGNEHLDYANTLNNLRINQMEQSHFEESVETALQSLKIVEKNLGTEHPTYADYREGLAYAFLLFGRYKEADSLCQLNLNFWQQRAPRSSEYADALLLHTFLLRNNGQYEKSLQLAKEALAIKEALYGKESRRANFAINALARSYKRQKKYAEAIYYKREELVRDSLVFGAQSDDYATDLRNWAELCFLMGKPVVARDSLLACIEIYKKVHNNDNNVGIGIAWAILAEVYEQMGKLPEAEDAANKGLAILERKFGKENIDRVKLLQHHGSALLASKKTEEAMETLRENRALTFKIFKDKLGYLASTEQIKLLEEYPQDFFPTAAAQYKLPELAAMCYDNALFFKGMALRNSRSLRDLLHVSKDTVQLALYDSYLRSQQDIAAEYRLPPVQRTRLDSLQTASDNLERDLIAQSPAYRAHIARYDVNWQAVQKKLQPGDAAIEFVRYNKQRVIDTDTFMYAAVVLLPGQVAPVFVNLCSEGVLRKKMFGERDLTARDGGWANTLYFLGEKTRDAIPAKDASLYDLLWKPLESDTALLRGVRRIYYAPDGLLHQISFAALGYVDKGFSAQGYKDESGNVYLNDRFELVRIGSTWQLLADGTPDLLKKGEDVLVVGNVDYGLVGTKTSFAATRSVPCKVLKPVGVSEFADARQACGNYGLKVDSLSGAAATEQALMGKLKRPTPYRAISLMTHGIFLPVPDKCFNFDHLYSEVNPMQRSCLVFAGYNAVDSIGNYGDDCLLTAQDFAGLNLKGTELVAITACQSGLGDVLSSEGVFGLQRAFREAGARYLIISLWDLPDSDTNDFMKIFYEKWLQDHQSVPEAFRAAQATMRKTARDTYRWGGLILIE